MEQHYYLRVVTEGDMAAVRRLHVQSLAENPSGFIQPESVAFRGYIDQRLHRYAELSGELIGAFANYGDRLVAVGGIVTAGDGRAELCDLFVRDDCKRNGIGRRIVQHLIDRAEQNGFNTVTLHVTATQVPALNLYGSLGFGIISRAVIDIEDLSYDTVYMERPTVRSK